MKKIIKENGGHIYSLTSSLVRSDDHYAAVVYGISVSGDGSRAEIRDISDNYDLVCELFELIAEEELYPEHLYDVTEDFLADHFYAMVSADSRPKRIA